VGAPELREFLVSVSQEGNEKFLVKIFDEIGAGLGMMDVKRLFDRVIDEVGILQDKRIPGGFIASQATGNKRLFFLGHNSIV